MWSETEQKELQEILKRYPNKRSAILPALYLAQREKKIDQAMQQLLKLTQPAALKKKTAKAG